MNVIGIFGGTFDPIHHGHLRTALELKQQLALSTIKFLPAGSPPHRPVPMASAAVRRRMLEAAIVDVPGFEVDARELARAGPSFTVDTLSELRREHPAEALCLLLGMDSFATLPSWSRWEQLLQLAHLVVVKRPGTALPASGPIADLCRLHALDAASLHRRRAGGVLLTEVTQLEISASALRRSIATGMDPRFLVPASVRAIMLETRCYG